jgi:hypothetical protein
MLQTIGNCSKFHVYEISAVEAEHNFMVPVFSEPRNAAAKANKARPGKDCPTGCWTISFELCFCILFQGTYKCHTKLSMHPRRVASPIELCNQLYTGVLFM